MSITVTEIVLHQLHQTQDEPPQLNTVLRENLLAITPEAEQMMLQLHQTYQGKAKAYGVFKSESTFAQQLNRLLEQETDFLPFSHSAAKMLANELAKYPFASGGTFILCRYTFLATEYLFIGLIDSRSSILVDDQLEVKRTEYLEITQYDIACRINLTELKLDAQSNRYLTFIKGRVGRKVADFFMDFLSADEGLNPQLQNQTLLQAVSDYCEQGELNSNQTQAVKKQAFDYCKGQINSGEEIAIGELSAALPTLNEQDFATFTQNQEYGLEENIPPVRNALKTLTKYSGSGKGVTISFDAELLSQRIIWDELNDTLTIKGLPANLRDQLTRNK
ncbi:nucleoid-associated protein YejK [Ursidibacter maritimus]|uniref:Nucleoid-associated protein HT657_03520 n=1 Tax=Ursidibacter maritimus TaxID=1331689 RepID=A0A949WQG0_9PAST|nr:nucleoid-associated protein YejK [Ursidibacter maritimus]KAE9539207.1 nucleoid-associated protein YejK [Ursidibacter maritimus]MBV6523964.1 nucleoid-associated protein YejK [Ursidibacter maritimus]MBV6525465.1 nucleoid-associated protein YejK [Ursidibacter maritimus]MBV6526935.1 nucleoid-associated protein YejK [Ursidibacter maritimus]MBV6530210.1 nucleoid-associated protein YejK [Ursidibacter maritimus]